MNTATKLLGSIISGIAVVAAFLVMLHGTGIRVQSSCDSARDKFASEARAATAASDGTTAFAAVRRASQIQVDNPKCFSAADVARAHGAVG